MRISKTRERKFFVPEDPDKAWIKIKHLLPGESQDIFDQVFVQKIDYEKGKKGKMEPKFSQETNKRLDRELTMQTCITGWGEFYDRKDQKMKCTPENIVRASREIDGFNEFVNECRETMAADIKQEKEDQRKNLKPSASGPEK
jgi:hypothetical protein